MYLNVTPPIPFFMETCTMATPGILSRVFLFYFEKISSRSDLFQVLRKIPAEIQDLASMKFVLKKKNVLKIKTNLHSVQWKISKWKEMKVKEMNKVTYTINYKFIWNINKIINYCCLVVSLICLSFIKYNLLYCCFINYKIINCCLT